MEILINNKVDYDNSIIAAIKARIYKLHGGEQHATSSKNATGLPWFYGLEPADPTALSAKWN